MALMRLNEFRDTFAEGSRPDPRTIVGWIQGGQLYGKRWGKVWYVDPDRPVNDDIGSEASEQVATETVTPILGGLHPLAQKVLEQNS